MKLSYKAQSTLCFFIIIAANILTDVFGFWLYRSLGWVLCGLLFMAHPVVPNGMSVTKQTIFWTRIAGLIMILIGIFTRVHHS